MKIKYFFIGILLSGISFVSQANAESNNIIREMAAVLLHLEFYADLNTKHALKKIANDESYSANQRILARAIVNIEHRALNTDIPDLKKIMNDETATASEQELAYIISHLKYKASNADKETLKKIIK